MGDDVAFGDLDVSGKRDLRGGFFEAGDGADVEEAFFEGFHAAGEFHGGFFGEFDAHAALDAVFAAEGNDDEAGAGVDDSADKCVAGVGFGGGFGCGSGFSGGRGGGLCLGRGRFCFGDGFRLRGRLWGGGDFCGQAENLVSGLCRAVGKFDPDAVFYDEKIGDGALHRFEFEWFGGVRGGNGDEQDAAFAAANIEACAAGGGFIAVAWEADGFAALVGVDRGELVALDEVLDAGRALGRGGGG